MLHCFVVSFSIHNIETRNPIPETMMSSALSRSNDRDYEDSAGNDPLLALAKALAGRIRKLKPVNTTTLLQALHDALDGPDAAARQARTIMQLHLVRVSDRLLAGGPVAPHEDDPMLTTENAAQLMQCSRPYVAMLVDRGQLPGAVKSGGGHRRVPRSSVLAWIEAHETRDSTDYRAAAKVAGMYEIPEKIYISVAGGAKRKRA